MQSIGQLLFTTRFPKCGHHTGGKELTHGIKHHKDN